MTSSISLAGADHRPNSLLNTLQDLWPTRPPRRRVVDVRDLPDHLKRDLGLLDGSRPVGGVRW